MQSSAILKGFLINPIVIAGVNDPTAVQKIMYRSRFQWYDAKLSYLIIYGLKDRVREVSIPGFKP
jgi:hypothetical protein